MNKTTVLMQCSDELNNSLDASLQSIP